MKKISTLVLLAALSLSMAACNTAKTPSDTAKTPAESSQPVEQIEKYQVPTDYIQGYEQAWMPKDGNAAVIITYHPAVKTLSDILKRDLAWPTELTEDWKGWGYSDIKISDKGFSVRTTLQKHFNNKHGEQIKTELAKMKEACPEVTFNLTGEGTNGAPYTELTVPAGTDMQKVKSVTYSALFLQAWSLIPEQFQGITVTVGDKAYTLDEILAA